MEVPISEPETVREALPQFECGLCDRESVHTIAQILLLGLATACVDSTTGDLFRSPSSVAVDTRRELINYLTLRSESLVAESVLHDDLDPSSDHPTDIVADLSEDFAATKRNLLGRVSGWLLSESREDKIDDFVQELETNAFWFLARRETVAESLLRNVDFRNEFHCVARFESQPELADHRVNCPFRVVSCGNDGCTASHCASQAEKHDGECPYKVLACEQGCGELIVRREMDRHCITVCSMKLVNCTFYPVGCRSTVPRCGIAQHCEANLNLHVVYVLQKMRKAEEVTEEIKEYALLLEKYQSDNDLSEALDVRSLTVAIKRLEPKVKKLESERKAAEQEKERLQEKKSEDQGKDHLQDNKPEDDQGKDHIQEKKPEGDQVVDHIQENKPAVSDHGESHLQDMKPASDQDEGYLQEKKPEDDQGEHVHENIQEGEPGKDHSQETLPEGDHDEGHPHEKTVEEVNDHGPISKKTNLKEVIVKVLPNKTIRESQ